VEPDSWQGFPETPVQGPSVIIFLGPGLVGLAAVRRRFKK